MIICIVSAAVASVNSFLHSSHFESNLNSNIPLSSNDINPHYDVFSGSSISRNTLYLLPGGWVVARLKLISKGCQDLGGCAEGGAHMSPRFTQQRRARENLATDQSGNLC